MNMPPDSIGASDLVKQTVTETVIQTVDELTPRNVFSFNAPRQTLVGEGAIVKIGELLASYSVRHVLIVADQVIYQRGLLSSALRSLARADIDVSVFSGIEREPALDVVDNGLAMLQQSRADFVLGFGGGSAMDAAKVIAMMGSCNCSLSDLEADDFSGRRSVGLGAVPTTAGTGSEVTDISVIMDADRHKKCVAKQTDLMPDLAIIDPGLMLELPAAITAATGIDALTHAIEAYVADGTNCLSQALAIAAIREIIHSLPRVVGNGSNMTARLGMAVAAYKAGLAFCNAGLGLVHALSHQVGPQYGIAHGVANGILLPQVMRFNALVSCDEYAVIAQALGASRHHMTQRQRCDAGIAAVEQLLSDIGLPNSLAPFNARVEDFSALASATLQDICLKKNPRQVTAPDVIQLLQQVMNPRAVPG